MNLRNFFALIFMGAATTAFAQTAQDSGRPEFYAQPSVVFAFPGHLADATGGAIALGVSIHRAHSIEIEGIRFNTSVWGETLKMTPVLATYKYSLPLVQGLSVTVGGSVGSTNERVDYMWQAMYSEPVTWVHLSENAFTYGVSGGLNYRIADHVSVDANVKALNLAKTNITTSGGITLVTVGVKFGF